MMKKLLFLGLLIFFGNLQAQLSEKMVGKWILTSSVSTEFTDSESAMKQVSEYAPKYSYLDQSSWTFKKDKTFEAKLKNGTVEKGSYSANEDRFIIIFDKEDIEEFNTTNIKQEGKNIILLMGRGMTKLKFDFAKK